MLGKWILPLADIGTPHFEEKFVGCNLVAADCRAELAQVAGKGFFQCQLSGSDLGGDRGWGSVVLQEVALAYASRTVATLSLDVREGAVKAIVYACL